MRDTLHESLRRLRWTKIRKNRMFVLMLVLSLVVSADVFWMLRQPGLTLAGDATCGVLDHRHDEQCSTEVCICEITDEQHIHEETCFVREITCGLEEHSHEIICYSDDTADVETQLDWQDMFAAYPYTGNLREDLVGIAQTQVGYSESELNYEVGEDGVRRGYTRYGAWYGAPYGDWSAMFVSFCLHYAGADPVETPGNTGADSMAQLWDNLDKYAPAGRYVPAAGDLVFFTDNTAGIVTEVQSAAIFVICGDVNGMVSGEMLPLDSPSIAGWGLTEGTVSSEIMPMPMSLGSETGTLASQNPDMPMPQQDEENPDDSDSPEDSDDTDTSEDEVKDLMDYLEKVEGSDFDFVLIDVNDVELPKEGENYIVNPDTGYRIVLSILSPSGFAPGTYTYQIPNGMMVNGGSGIFELDTGEVIGTWVVTDEGLITMVFNKDANRFSNVTVSATMGIVFPEMEEPLDFDGKITVTIEKPPVPERPTIVKKWGFQGGPNNDEYPKNPDETKLYWSVQLIGNTDSQLPGSVITDQLMTSAYDAPHHYTDSDMAGGLYVIAAEKDPVTGEEHTWHTWEVYPGDPALTWTSTGWTYQLPETASCGHCGSLTLGNAEWNYMIKFTSTPDPADVGGALTYWNRVNADGQTADAWTRFYHSKVNAEVVKTGTLHGDAGGGSFNWEIQVHIPGREAGKKAAFAWFIIDNMDIREGEWTSIGRYINDINNAVVTAAVNGTSVTVPHIYDATEDDPFAWHIPWSSADGNGVEYGRTMEFVCLCNCTEENCPRWENGQCAGVYWFEPEDGGDWVHKEFCQCWTVERNTTFTITYKTDAPDVVDRYGGVGYNLRNEVLLYQKEKQPDGRWEGSYADGDYDLVSIPGVFKKELNPEMDGYIANYKITVNEGKLVLTNGAPLTIYDEMSDTLAYVNGSLVITTEDTEGNTGTLQQGVDFTTAYDGTGTQKNEQGKPVHVLTIVILRPQPVKYTLNYDTALIIPAGTISPIKYTNSANVTLWGRDMTENSIEKIYANITIAAKSYRVDMLKTDSKTGDPLAGATFGLFNAQGGQISSNVTDRDGRLFFQTDVENGIIFREHELYYLQELYAPAGYQLDSTPHWFCFCNKTEDTCTACDSLLADKPDAVRIPFKEIRVVEVTNEVMYYDLPSTGGMGVYPLILLSVIFIIIPIVYGFILRRKQERRGVG